MFFYGNYFVVVVAVAVAIVLFFVYVDFVVFAAGAVHTLFVYCVLTVVEIVAVVVVVADDVVVVVSEKEFIFSNVSGHFPKIFTTDATVGVSKCWWWFMWLHENHP